MSSFGDAFKELYGSPDPAERCKIRLERSFDQMVLDSLMAEFGREHFRNGFFRLLGDGSNGVDQVLESWKFIFPDDVPRTVVGHNA